MSCTLNKFAEKLIAELKTLDPSLKNSDIFVQTKELPGNVTRTGICVRQPDSDVAPLFYIDDAYEAYTDGIPVKDLASELLGVLKRYTFPGIDIPSLRDFNVIKDHIICGLVSGSSDKYLSERPSLPLGNTGIRIVWDIAFPESGKDSYTMPVMNSVLNRWDGITPDEIQTHALKNTPCLRPMQFTSVSDFLMRICGNTGIDDTDDGTLDQATVPSTPLLFLSNRRGLDGAAVILYPEAIETLNTAFPHGCWLIPSSVHEWLVLDKRESSDPDCLRGMVREVNAKQVRPDEVLSYDVFELKDGVPMSVKKELTAAAPM